MCLKVCFGALPAIMYGTLWQDSQKMLEIFTFYARKKEEKPIVTNWTLCAWIHTIWRRRLPGYICITWYIINKVKHQQTETGNILIFYKRLLKDIKSNTLTPSIGIAERWIWNKIVLPRILQYEFYNLLAICQWKIFFQEPFVCNCVWIICTKQFIGKTVVLKIAKW